MMLLAAALLLLVSTIAAWFVAAAARPSARVQLRFASVLLAACGVAVLGTPTAAPAVVLLVLPIVVAVLVLAAQAGFEHALAPSLSSLVLALASLCGIVGAATGLALIVLAASVLGTAALLVLSARRFRVMHIAAAQGALSALCLLAAQSLFVIERVSVPFLLFVSAALLGVTLALSRSDVAAQQKATADLRGAAISGRRSG